MRRLRRRPHSPDRRIDPPIGILPVFQPEMEPEMERFSISQTTEGVITTPNVDLINHAIRYSFAPIWRYQVPVNTQIVFRPGDRFYLQIKDGVGTEWSDEQEVQIIFWNAVKKELRVVFTGFYMDVKEPVDIDRMAMYQITQPHVVPGGGWIYLEGLAPIAPHTIDSAISHFSLETQRVRQRI